MTSAEETREIIAADQVVKMHLACCIAHLLETLRDDSARHTDLIAAQACLTMPSVQNYLASLPPVMFPVTRDGEPPLTFPTP
jgi:hypothetical protein